MSTYDKKVSKKYCKLHYKKPISELLKEYEISPQDLESTQKVIKLITNNDDNEYRLVTRSILYIELPYMAEQLSLKTQRRINDNKYTHYDNKFNFPEEDGIDSTSDDNPYDIGWDNY